MNLDLSSQITDFMSAQTSWRSVSVSFPDSANIDSNGTDIAEVSKLFDDIERLLSSLNGTAASGIIWSVQQPLLASALGTLKTVLPDVPNSITLTIQNLPVIFSSLLEVQDVLTKLFPGGPLTAAQMRSAQSKAEAISNLLLRMEALEVTLNQISSDAAAAFKFLEDGKNSADLNIANIQASVAQSSLEKTEIEKLRLEVDQILILANTTNASIAQVALDLNASVAVKEALFQDFENIRDTTNKLLENASKVGLAKSFRDERLRKRWPMGIWGSVFVTSLVIIGVSGNKVLNEFFKNQLTANNLNNLSPSSYEFLAKLALTTPFILIAVFAAKQFSLASRISEDYAFKEATALAYTGYRNEVAADADLLRLLQLNAISHFGENPMHLISSEDDSSSFSSETAKAIAGIFDRRKSP